MNKSHPLQVLAVTSGLSDERIAELWREAERFAGSQVADQESHEYAHLLHQQMNELIEQEALGNMPHIEAPWVMFDTHLAMACVALADNLQACVGHVRHYLHPEAAEQSLRQAHKPTDAGGVNSRAG